jgi:hypothetical protein
VAKDQRKDAKQGLGQGLVVGGPDKSFIVAASDSKGQSVRVWARVQPSLDRMVEILLHSQCYPFKTKGDVVRWCVDKGVKELVEEAEKNGFRGKLDSSILRQIDTINGIVRAQQFCADFNETVRNVSEAVGKLQDVGATGECRRLLFEVATQIEKMPKGWWRDRYRKELKDRWGRYMEEIQASLKVSEQEEEEGE